jgi:hypothetical protein
MSDQSDAANEFARKHLGAEVDAAAGASGIRVLPGGVESDDNEPPSKPWVELPGRGNRVLADFARDMGATLATAPIFRRENVIVTVEAGTGLLLPMSPERFLTWVTSHCVIYDVVESGRGQDKKSYNLPKTMPVTTAKGCLASDLFAHAIREILRVNPVRMPVRRADGRCELLPEGYDDEAQIYTLPSRIKIDETMSLEKAVTIWRSYLSEFGWSDIEAESGRSRSLSVAVCAALALFGMGMQSPEAARMGFMYRANTQGGGKSLLAQLAITPSFGLAKNTPKSEEAELRKVLDAAALQGSSYLFLDNLKGHVESALLEGFMTSPVWSGRVMATQRMFETKKSTVLIITGNNLSVSPDLQRRMLQCDVFVEEFDLQEKEHARDLNPGVLNRAEVRSELLSALWAMIRNWDAIGRPKAHAPGSDKPFRIATFAEWSDIFGGITQAAGFGNPLERPKDDELADQKTLHQRRLVESLAHDLTPTLPVKRFEFQELVDCCNDNDFFRWLLDGKVRTSDGGIEHYEASPRCRRMLGLFFSKEMHDRIFSLADQKRVRFRGEGEGRSRRFTVELVISGR